MSIDVEKIATGNVELLKQMSLEEVLQVHPLISAQHLTFGTAKKTKPIKAKPINSILNKSEQSVFESVLLNTLEGTQSLKPGSFICWGEAGDVWQQSHKALHQKYNPTVMDEDGFVTYVPKPDGDGAVMNASEIKATAHTGKHGGFSITNPWWGDERVANKSVLERAGIDLNRAGIKLGEIPNGSKIKTLAADEAVIFLHYGVVGDWVLQKQDCEMDAYRVAKKFFEATYVTV